MTAIQVSSSSPPPVDGLPPTLPSFPRSLTVHLLVRPFTQFVQLPEEYLKRLVEICLNAKMDGTVLSLALTCKALHKVRPLEPRPQPVAPHQSSTNLDLSGFMDAAQLMLPLLLENVCLMVKPGTPHGDAFESRFDSLASLVTLRQRRPYVRYVRLP